ncbi:NAD(P)H-dependent glycerol-3-phosphate dehydrogenase [Metamycoplasma neophronis]|uniref:Glycerol-3-phosphate dehydrogenase n=1 Tax=Metamycoplasma neophronis TaxID=872983 RepID=A0ABY2Z280_9BACT|nr:NAD(P)H-dependent glycerol-3-phosphate dehydrogenase [Metamycoplasma neophronis]TPR54110.1 NAD(P)H-dependent glycerol-3-phosphate dehydrogenase [Metamycoplasma neophronis]
MKNKIAILGSGAMGTACATVLANNNHDIIIYGIDLKELSDLEKGCNTKYFSDQIKIPSFTTTTDLSAAIKDVDYILFAIPTKFLPSVFELVINKLEKKVIIINVAKGFWPESNISVHEKMDSLTKLNKNVKGIVSLIGPSFALDIVNRNITLVDAVSYDLELANDIQNLFSNDYFRVYSQTDVKGAEAGAIFKNIIAIASGMLDALGYSTNTQIALLTRSIVEMKEFTKFIGGNIETNNGLTGLGDLMLTALSDKSRNYTYGKNFFNKDFDANKLTIEGLKSIEVVYNQYIKNKTLDLPIIESIYKIIYLKNDPNEIIKTLMKRPLKTE